jgi:DNA-binding MarR family transcriptional regulator
VRSAPDPADGRVRIVRTTDKGVRALTKAVPLWQDAQAQVEKALGQEATTALNGLLDLSSGRLRLASDRPEPWRRGRARYTK